MMASQNLVPNSLAGILALLDPSPSIPSSPGLPTIPSQDDADIRALLQTLPTKPPTWKHWCCRWRSNTNVTYSRFARRFTAWTTD